MFFPLSFTAVLAFQPYLAKINLEYIGKILTFIFILSEKEKLFFFFK